MTTAKVTTPLEPIPTVFLQQGDNKPCSRRRKRQETLCPAGLFVNEAAWILNFRRFHVKTIECDGIAFVRGGDLVDYSFRLKVISERHSGNDHPNGQRSGERP